jgi:hypothetical protein
MVLDLLYDPICLECSFECVDIIGGPAFQHIDEMIYLQGIFFAAEIEIHMG